MTSPATSSGQTIIDSGSSGVPGMLMDPRVEVGVVGEHRLGVADRPAGDAGVERALVLEDHLRERGRATTTARRTQAARSTR